MATGAFIPIYIYSYDGSTLLMESEIPSGYMIFVSENKISYGSETIIYNYGDYYNNTLLGFSLSPNSSNYLTNYEMPEEELFLYLYTDIDFSYEVVDDPTPYLIEKGTLQTLGNVIRYKTNNSNEITPNEMIDIIETIPVNEIKTCTIEMKSPGGMPGDLYTMHYCKYENGFIVYDSITVDNAPFKVNNVVINSLVFMSQGWVEDQNFDSNLELIEKISMTKRVFKILGDSIIQTEDK